MLFFSFQWFTLTDCTFKPTFFPILSPCTIIFLGICVLFITLLLLVAVVFELVIVCIRSHRMDCASVTNADKIFCDCDSEAGQRLLDLIKLGNLSVSQTCVRWYADGFRSHLLAVCESTYLAWFNLVTLFRPGCAQYTTHISPSAMVSPRWELV